MVGARRHHLPRFHLERFANERLQIATVDRRTGQRRIIPIKDTAAGKDFYTAINSEGEKDNKSEHLLAIRLSALGRCAEALPVTEQAPPGARS